MPSSFEPITRYVSRGFDQSSQRHLTDSKSCWDLLNLKPVRGRLEQTPWLEQFRALSGPNNTTPVHLVYRCLNATGTTKYLVWDESYARYVDQNGVSENLIPSVFQKSKPIDSTVRGECLLYGINATDLPNDLDTIQVQVHTDGSHFRWRYNSGAWSSDLVIGPAVALTGSTGLLVSFQGAGAIDDYTNYTIGNTWTWQRINIFGGGGDVTTRYFPFSTDCFSTDVYIGGVDRHIFRLRNNFTTSVGYTPVYGMHVAVFYEHLFVSQFAFGGTDGSGFVTDTYNPTTTPFTIGWSQLDNPDQFFATQINEADSKTLNQADHIDVVQGFPVGITGLAVWRGLLYVFLQDTCYMGQYVGQPSIMNFTPINASVGSIFRAGVVKTPMGLYFIGRGDVYRISLYEPQPIGAKVRTKFFEDIKLGTDYQQQRTFGFYNPQTKEVIWTYFVLQTYTSGGFPTAAYIARQMVYCELTDDWYFRNIPSEDAGLSNPMCGTALFNSTTQSLYGYTGLLARDQNSGSVGTPYNDNYDDSHTPYFTQPFFETPFLGYGDPFHIKEASGMYLDASWVSALQLTVSQAAKDFIGDGSTTMVALTQPWTPSIAEKLLSLPRSAYRHVAYRCQFVASSLTTAVRGAIFNLYEELVRGPNTRVEK